MKSLLFACLLLCPAAQAQVIECPKFYPFQDTPLTEVPSGHKGKGLVSKSFLTDASAFIGDFNDGGELQGLRKEVKGGYDVQLPTVTKWLVCWYGDGQAISWWEELKPDSKITRCTLQVRGRDEVTAKLICK